MSFMIITCFISVEGEMCELLLYLVHFGLKLCTTHTLAEKHGFWVFENRLLTTVYRIKREREREREKQEDRENYIQRSHVAPLSSYIRLK
jgi:hypothetical protein